MSTKMTKKFIVANWKMNPLSLKEAESLFLSINKKIFFKKNEVVICPPYIYMDKLKKISKKIYLGAQDAFWGDTGAFTGEISTEMLSSLGVKYVILGHSERRELGETNFSINKKLKSSLSSGMIPILCVGDKERDKNHEYFSFVRKQLEECLNGIKKEFLCKLIIAYEPVWALSTTKDRRDATSEDSKEMNIFIKKIIASKFGINVKMPKIIYGGSVNEKNVEDFLVNGNVDGVLIGGASLKLEKFLEIVRIAEKI